MKLLELNHTFSRFNKIKNDLLRLVSIIGCISMVLFAGYYVYLITLNFERTIYLVIYSILFLTIMATFIVESSLSENDAKSRKNKRIITEKKRKIKAIIKVPKYIAKIGLIAVAVFEMSGDFSFTFSNILNIFLAIWLIIQILSEFIVHYTIKYVDYIKLAIEQDMNESFLLKAFRPGKTLADKMEDISYAVKGESKYTEQEIKMINENKEEKEKFEQQQNNEKKETLLGGVQSVKNYFINRFKRKDSKNKN